MPAYFSIEFQYQRERLAPDCLGILYRTLMHDEFSFGGVLAWGCPADLSLQEITQWNQERLNADFVLGFTEDVYNDYRQVLLKHPSYSECRVIISNHLHAFTVIVPESNVCAVNSCAISGVQISPLKRLAVAVWRTGLVAAVQTYDERGAATPLNRIQTGALPSAAPFAIVGVLNKAVSELEGIRLRVTPLDSGGYLLEALASST